MKIQANGSKALFAIIVCPVSTNQSLTVSVFTVMFTYTSKHLHFGIVTKVGLLSCTSL